MNDVPKDQREGAALTFTQASDHFDACVIIFREEWKRSQGDLLATIVQTAGRLCDATTANIRPDRQLMILAMMVAHAISLMENRPTLGKVRQMSWKILVMCEDGDEIFMGERGEPAEDVMARSRLSGWKYEMRDGALCTFCPVHAKKNPEVQR